MRKIDIFDIFHVDITNLLMKTVYQIAVDRNFKRTVCNLVIQRALVKIIGHV